MIRLGGPFSGPFFDVIEARRKTADSPTHGQTGAATHGQKEKTMEKLDLQRFAEDGGIPAGGGDVTGAEGTQAGQGANQEQQRPSFDELIKGEYKQDYDQRVQAAIQTRFRNQKDLQKQVQSYAPIMQALGQKYGRDPGDVDGIARLLTDDDSLYADEANRLGLPVETVKTMKKLEAERDRALARERESTENMALQQHFQRISQQAEELKQTFPSFDLMTELQNPRFAMMTSPNVGISVRDAFYAIHGEEIQRQSMQYAAQQAGQRIAASVRAGASRPMENGMQKQAPVQMGVNIRGMDKKTREEYFRRIKNGETINFVDKI